MIRKWRKRKSVLMWSSHASTTTLLPLKVQMAISLPWLRSARESLDRKRKTDASCRFLEIIPAMMEGKKCTGICTLANVRRMSIYTGEVPLAIASSQFCNLQQFFHAQFCQFASHQIPCLQKPKFLLTVLPWTPLMIQKMVQFVKFSSISPDGKNQQASIGSPDIHQWLFLALPTPYP